MTIFERLMQLCSPEGDAGGSGGGTGGSGGGTGDGTGGSASPQDGGGKDGGGQGGAGESGRKDGEGASRKSVLAAGAGSDGAKDGKTGDGGKDGQGKPDKAGPDSYKLTVPEGWKDVDQKQLGAFTKFAQESGFTAEQGSKALAYYAQLQKQEQETWAKQDQDWYGALEKDSEFGGAKHAESLAALQKALKKFDPQGELKKDMGALLIENLPSLAKFLARVGRADADDKPSTETAGKDAGKKLTTQERRKSFYDKVDKE